MASNSIPASPQRSQATGAIHNSDVRETSASAFITLAGRILFSAIFIMSGFFHFSQQDIAYATQAGIPMAGFLVPASGILALLGGLSILIGYKAKLGAWLLVVFLIPVTLAMHNIWAVIEPHTAKIKMD